MIDINPVVLSGKAIALESFSDCHRDELEKVAQDERIWEFHADKALGSRFHQWFDKAIQKFKNKEQLPFIVRRLEDNKIIGSTRYYDIKPGHKRSAIGNTWYIPEVWGTLVNAESKYLLLKYAFEIWCLNRVEFMTDARNTRSRAAVKKLGAVEEGVCRNHMVLEDGHVRDTVIYSIVQPDWESIKKRLQARLEDKC